LGDVSPGQELDDEKIKFEAQPDLETTQRVFKRTLTTLKSFIEEHGKPSVAVVSGDLTYRARTKGFKEFAKLLTDRAEVLPDDPSRIVVVPGNHDVVWDEPPGDPKRYAGFLNATRQLGCTTPLLDGVDFAADDEDGNLTTEGTERPHLVSDEDLLVVPLNTSNYCGMLGTIRDGWTEDEWRSALKPLKGKTGDAMEQVKKLRQHDVARVSLGQIAALGRLFDATGEPRARSGDRRVRVAVLHHQLLPVSTREERKPFESLVNLGLVRQTLRDYGVDLVLHGHKHESGLYWDAVGPGDGQLDAPLRLMLVIASPGHFKVDEPAMRALTLTGNQRARNLRVTTFMGSTPSRKHATVDDEQQAPLWLGEMSSESPERTTIRAVTAHAAYARLRSAFELRDGQPLTHLVCHVDNAGDAGALPPDYPEVGFDDPQEWFTQLVAWWQLDRSELVARGITPFNHGERIYRRWGNQVERAIRLLNKRDDSSRALVQLVDPRETGRYANDERSATTGTFPAFALAEFTIAKRDGRRHLDCFAYFRKQEMQYWWPVNLAELSLLQEMVRTGLKNSALPGRVVTFTAIALWDDALPGVAVPELDRLVEDRDRGWTLAAALAFPETAAEEAEADWRRLLADLAGSGRKAPPRPAAGVEVLLEDIVRFERLSDSRALETARVALEGLLKRYEALGEGELNESAADLLREEAAKLRGAVQDALGESAS
jgi:3',5'-cyclic AMP phosphodiesterase CpdA